MIEFLIFLNSVLLACVALFSWGVSKVYRRFLKKMEMKENACEAYLQKVKKEVAAVCEIQSDITELKQVTLSNQLKKGR